jgi:DNA-binding GntR family transcriptional regulator
VLGHRKTPGSRISDPYSIDRESFEPAYLQLTRIIQRQISDGLFRPGDRLPSEAELRSRHDVSPMTVRRAINMLADQDMVTAEQGRGTFVKHLKLSTAKFHLKEMHNLFSDPSQAKVKILGVRIVKADELVSARLDLKPGDRVIYIQRLLLMHDEPSFYHREYLVYDPKKPIVEAEMEFTSLEGLFNGSGRSLFKMGELAVEAALMTEEEARVLNAKIPSAALALTHVFYDYQNRPISWGWFVCRSDRQRLVTKVGID